MHSGKSKNGLTIFVHVMVWVLLGFILLFFPPLTWDIKVPASFWIKQSLNIFILAGVFYFNALYMTPKFLFQEKRAVFITWFVAALVFFLITARIIEINLHVMEEMTALSPNKNQKVSFTWIYIFSLLHC